MRSLAPQIVRGSTWSRAGDPKVLHLLENKLMRSGDIHTRVLKELKVSLNVMIYYYKETPYFRPGSLPWTNKTFWRALQKLWAPKADSCAVKTGGVNTEGTHAQTCCRHQALGLLGAFSQVSSDFLLWAPQRSPCGSQVGAGLIVRLCLIQSCTQKH